MTTTNKRKMAQNIISPQEFNDPAQMMRWRRLVDRNKNTALILNGSSSDIKAAAKSFTFIDQLIRDKSFKKLIIEILFTAFTTK